MTIGLVYLVFTRGKGSRRYRCRCVLAVAWWSLEILFFDFVALGTVDESEIIPTGQSGTVNVD